MASKLVMTFAGNNGVEHFMTYNYIDAETAGSTVRALVNGIIANGSIFTNVPATVRSAKIVSTTEKVINLS